MMEIHFAPLQGYTDCCYRNLHNRIFGGVDAYYTPFVRMEHGELRKKDIRDLLPENDNTGKLIPQVIVRDVQELDFLVSAIREMGYNRIDVNMGCPFPMQTKKGRGAGLLPFPEDVEKLSYYINDNPEVDFSIKMRLGCTDTRECLRLLPVLNGTRLKHIAVHPRIAVQQYKGDLDMNTFEEFMDGCEKPIIFNGELRTIEDIDNVVKRYPNLMGVMIGRGMLMHPSLASEYVTSKTPGADELLRLVLELHSGMYEHYSKTLQGDSHLLMKMKIFWEYLEDLIGHKNYKLIKKAVTITKYNAVVASL